MNIFQERTFNSDEQAVIKNVVDDTIQSLEQIKDLQEHIKELHKGACDKLNEKVDEKELFVKAKLFMKLAKAKMKEDVQEQKEGVDEVETGLELIYKM